MKIAQKCAAQNCGGARVEKLLHDLLPVVDRQHDLRHAGVHEHLDDVRQLRLVRKLDERLRLRERERPQLSTETAH